MQGAALELTRQGVQTGIMILLPILAVALFVGLLVSILQALTQIQEQTLTFVPKLIGIAILMVLMGHWMLGEIVGFTKLAFKGIEAVGRGMR